MGPHFYNINVTWSKERIGLMSSPELHNMTPGNGSIEVATPPQFPKGIEGLWSPEHLFTAAVSSCFMTTFLAIAENFKLNFKGFSCDSSGKLEMVDGKLYMTEVHVKPVVTLYDDEDRERALKILNKTERSCLISNSITAKVIMEPLIQTVLCKA
ncbi:OsmC family protein [Fulvivirga sp. 29W222]|uniref:OsmC family protein n=1 Tax=Fulvivirga marina TaxID=2494733 RepID=A0A937FZ43_9BACT|nr:OsmC family protein [Fulvivirga marina]MBL6448780.1 OsmC family protein [Fulvivirga marina]